MPTPIFMMPFTVGTYTQFQEAFVIAISYTPTRLLVKRSQSLSFTILSSHELRWLDIQYRDTTNLYTSDKTLKMGRLELICSHFLLNNFSKMLNYASKI